jgi:hypothetical protein
MSTNVVHEHGTEHLKVTAAAAHKAGDLVCERGFFGTVSEDNAAGDLITLRLVPTVNLPRVPSTLAMGTVVSSPATAQATTMTNAAAGATGFLAAVTAGWYPFGKVIATGTASTAKIAFFRNNPYNITMP